MLQQILEDVSEEHARKTITVDPFPHSGVPAASIHPCKHASVMKKLGNMAEANGKPFQVDRYVSPTVCSLKDRSTLHSMPMQRLDVTSELIMVLAVQLSGALSKIHRFSHPNN